MMKKFLIRFNKTRGQPGRGTLEHAWRVFVENKEYLVKNIKIDVPVWTEKSSNSLNNDDWNFACEGTFHIDRSSSTFYISENIANLNKYSIVNYGLVENAFSEKEIKDIIFTGESFNLSKARLSNREITDNYHEVRESKVSWIKLQEDNSWIFDKLMGIINSANSDIFNFNIVGFSEPLQYTVYEGENKSHFESHVDYIGGTSAPRKLSLVMQLSDPSEYEGGDLLIHVGHEPIKIKKKKGNIVIFPSFVLHKVTPVTSGIRKTLVAWSTGPAFK